MRPPDFNLGIGGGSHAEQTGKMLVELEEDFQSPSSRIVCWSSATRIQPWLARLPLPRRRYRSRMSRQV